MGISLTRGRMLSMLAAVLAAYAAAACPASGGEPLPDTTPTSHQFLIGPEMVVHAGPRLSPAAPYPTPAIDCTRTCPSGCEATWNALSSEVAFQEWAQGEYVGRARLPHVPTYRLRVDDSLEFVFRVDRNRLPEGYKLNVGDQIAVEMVTDSTLTRTLTVLPDGSISLPQIGSVPAAGSTAGQLRNLVEEKYREFYQKPSIAIVPIKVNSALEELRYAVAGQSGFGGQVYFGRVTPEGTIQLPAVGSVPAQGLTLDEFKLELDERFAEKIAGMEVMPVLSKKSPHVCYVLGEVERPGRYNMEAPMTVMQAIAKAGSWTVGAQITHVVVFRRADDWRLLATELDLQDALLGKSPCPAEEIWLADNDLVLVPKSKILRADNFIELVFTRGIYGVIPVQFSLTYEPFKGFLPFLPIF